MSRLPDGRVLELGFTYRSCQDQPPPQPASCRMALPAGICASGTFPDLCFCADPDPNWTGASDLVCGCFDRDLNDGINQETYNCEDRRVEMGLRYVYPPTVATRLLPLQPLVLCARSQQVPLRTV
jgi:hypothetical protein